MFKTISEFVIRVADLAEAEGRMLREQTVKVGLALGMVLGGVVLLLGALAALLAGLHIWLASTVIGPAGAWGIIGLAALMISGMMLMYAMRLAKGIAGDGAVRAERRESSGHGSSGSKDGGRG